MRADLPSSDRGVMDAAEYRNLRPMLGTFVRIVWRDPNQDWPYYRLLKISRGDGTICVRGENYPDGSAKHARNAFWANYADVKTIDSVLVGVG